MDVNEKVQYWLDTARYDLVTAKAMLEAKRFLYVGFLCHQVAEKCLKAYFWHSRKKEPPYTHNLLVLADQSEFDHLRSDYTPLFNELMPLNIQARYPDDKTLLLKSLNSRKCRTIYAQTRKFYTWIRKLLK